LLEEPADDGSNSMKYTFYMNDDNIALQTELKATKLHPALVKKQFEIGAVLVGLALIYDQQQKSGKNDHDESADSEVQLGPQVKAMTRALAPVLLPMIQALGDLTEEDANFEQLEFASSTSDETEALAEAL
jgi:hypothetical protein